MHHRGQVRRHRRLRRRIRRGFDETAVTIHHSPTKVGLSAMIRFYPVGRAALPPPIPQDDCLGPTNGAGCRKECHCEPQSGVAIRILCGAKRHPAPEGAGKRTDCHGPLALAMTWVSSVVPFNRGWWLSNLVGVGSAARPTNMFQKIIQRRSP